MAQCPTQIGNQLVISFISTCGIHHLPSGCCGLPALEISLNVIESRIYVYIWLSMVVSPQFTAGIQNRSGLIAELNAFISVSTIDTK